MTQVVSPQNPENAKETWKPRLTHSNRTHRDSQSATAPRQPMKNTAKTYGTCTIPFIPILYHTELPPSNGTRVETKFGELGIEEFGPFRSAQSYPPVQFVGYFHHSQPSHGSFVSLRADVVRLEVPYDVSLYNLRSVKLGDGIWTDFSVVDEYSEE